MDSSVRIIRMVLLVFVFACLAGCGEDESVVRVNMQRRMDLTPSAPTDAITYAYLPQYSHATSFERHRKLLLYLREETGLPLKQIFPDTFDEHVKMVERGEIDISFSNPVIYVQLAKIGSRAFARIVEPTGKPDFQGEIICRVDNPLIQNLEDCRGKRWRAVDPSSAGGYLFALGHFMEHGIAPEDFADISFAPGPGGKQEKVVFGVYSGNYDVGSIREGTLTLLRDRIDLAQLRVLARTRAYPGWVYSAREGLDEEVVQRIAKAMFTLNMESAAHKDILDAAHITGIIPGKDSDYDPVRALMTQIAASDEEDQ